MQKIQRVSKIFCWLFRLLLIFLPISFILFWINAPEGMIKHWLGEGWASVLAINYMANMPPVLHALSLKTKALGLSISLIPFAVQMLIFYFLTKLFKNYSQLKIFSLQNATYIKRIGWILLIGQLLKPLHDFLLSAVLTFDNPLGHRVATITFDQADFGLILCALMIMLVSWIMTEAYKEQETSQLII